LSSSPRNRGPSISEHVLRCWSVSALSVITWSPLARGRQRAGGLLPSPEQLPENLLGALGQFHQLVGADEILRHAGKLRHHRRQHRRRRHRRIGGGKKKTKQKPPALPPPEENG